MIVSAYGFNDVLSDHVVLDPSRVAAQVVSGIGFLGAGSILLRGSVIRGLTTAASIWTVAAIGLAIGGGLYFAGVASHPHYSCYSCGREAARGTLSSTQSKLPISDQGRTWKADARGLEEDTGTAERASEALHRSTNP
jgi:uncharacterized membrane protein YhiD involved in acid resistance